MGKRQLMLLVSLMLALSVFLAACTGDDDKEGAEKKEPAKGTDTEEVEEEVEEEESEHPGNAGLEYPIYVTNTGETIDDGELVYAQVSDSPFEGTLNKVFYSGAPDADVMQFFDENLLSTDVDYMITNDGAATYELSEDNKVIKLTIGDNVNWHDGEPVKASDLLYAYELLGHPEYKGFRYSHTIQIVEGMEEYHAGETDEISGIEISDDDKTITITYTIASPAILSGIWDAPVPRHHVGDVMDEELTVEELAASDKIRETPIGFGPYKVIKVVPGESVQYERYDDYWRGTPALQSLILQVYNNTSILKALEAGDVDLAEFPADQYPQALEADNIELLAKVDLAYTYIGFKLGKWDAEIEENVADPDSKLADKRVRQAMWHAMDNEVIGEDMYHGLRYPATTLMVPVFAYHDESNEGRGYDPAKAEELLDEAGFVDEDGDGFREDPDGNEFVLSFASMSGGETAEPIANHYIQNWADVGIKVELTDGRLIEFNAFYDLVEGDDPKIDIYQGAWGTGSDPDPSGIHGRDSFANYTRYANEEQDDLFEKGNSPEAFDFDFRKDIYNQWQELMVEEVPMAPTVYRYKVWAVNKRVAHYTVDQGSDFNLYEMGVTEAEAFAK